MMLRNVVPAWALLLFVVGWAGCSSDRQTDEPAPASTAVALHVHPATGPHQGQLIELGNDAYHAELLHDAQTVTVYVLNGAADQQVPIDAREITINLRREGAPRQFKLVAEPDTMDANGSSSRFVSADAELLACIDRHDAEPRLMLLIDGKSYGGTISHDHEHEGHAH